MDTPNSPITGPRRRRYPPVALVSPRPHLSLPGADREALLVHLLLLLLESSSSSRLHAKAPSSSSSAPPPSTSGLLQDHHLPPSPLDQASVGLHLPPPPPPRPPRPRPWVPHHQTS
ncbi:hypothetical protein NL676_004753 [Syzygium grande]|nr:hypothetical protein NL676_004753 [Syzygium grande]